MTTVFFFDLMTQAEVEECIARLVNTFKIDFMWKVSSRAPWGIKLFLLGRCLPKYRRYIDAAMKKINGYSGFIIIDAHNLDNAVLISTLDLYPNEQAIIRRIIDDNIWI